MKYPFFMLLLAAFAVPQQNLNAQGNNSKLVMLETGGCRGYCPMYKLTFRNDGILEYVGVRNVEQVGTFTARLGSEEFSNLLKELSKTDLWHYPSEIPSTVVDAPVHTYTVFDGAKSHSVKGTAGIPQPILALEALMQSIAEAHGFPVHKGDDPNQPGTLPGQAIVKFKIDVNARDFCNQFSDLKVRPVRHLSEDNTWVIGFDPAQMKEEQFLSLLKDMQGVLSAEPDLQIKSRN